MPVCYAVFGLPCSAGGWLHSLTSLGSQAPKPEPPQLAPSPWGSRLPMHEKPLPLAWPRRSEENVVQFVNMMVVVVVVVVYPLTKAQCSL